MEKINIKNESNFMLGKKNESIGTNELLLTETELVEICNQRLQQLNKEFLKVNRRSKRKDISSGVAAIVSISIPIATLAGSFALTKNTKEGMMASALLVPTISAFTFPFGGIIISGAEHEKKQLEKQKEEVTQRQVECTQLSINKKISFSKYKNHLEELTKELTKFAKRLGEEYNPKFLENMLGYAEERFGMTGNHPFIKSCLYGTEYSKTKCDSQLIRKGTYFDAIDGEFRIIPKIPEIVMEKLGLEFNEDQDKNLIDTNFLEIKESKEMIELQLKIPTSTGTIASWEFQGEVLDSFKRDYLNSQDISANQIPSSIINKHLFPEEKNNYSRKPQKYKSLTKKK